jgi:hypothetical protein
MAYCKMEPNGKEFYMGILDNLENAWDDLDHYAEHQNLVSKIFSETVCSDCSYESKPMVETDNMGREKFWEDLGRP